MIEFEPRHFHYCDPNHEIHYHDISIRIPDDAVMKRVNEHFHRCNHILTRMRSTKVEINAINTDSWKYQIENLKNMDDDLVVRTSVCIQHFFEVLSPSFICPPTVEL